MTKSTTWADALAHAKQAELRKIELKALKRTASNASHVTMKVIGIKQVEAFSDKGWELLSSVPLGRGAGFTSYLMRKPYRLVELDMTDDLVPDLTKNDELETIISWVENHHKKFPGQTSESFMTGLRTVNKLVRSGF